MIGAALLACASGPPRLDARRVEGGIDVSADRGLVRVEVVTGDGAPVAARDAHGQRVLAIAASPPTGATWRVRGWFAGGLVVEDEVAGPPLAVTVAVEAPAGQSPREVGDGDVVSAWSPAGGKAAVVLTADVPTAAEVRWGTEIWSVSLSTPGEQARVPIPLDGHRPVTVTTGAGHLTFTLEPRALGPTASGALALDGAWMPADPSGEADPTRPPDRVRLDRPWSSSTRTNPELPVSWQGVSLANRTDAPIDVVVRATVEQDGRPVHAFRSRARAQEDQPAVSVVVRVPANGVAVAALPLYVDPEEVVAPATYERHLAVIPLGEREPWHELRLPLAVDRGGRAAPAGFAAALATSALGWALLLGGARRFLTRSSTADLVTIGLFAGTTFVVGAAFQLVGLAVATVLGPFAPLLTGLLDDGFRAVLLGTLLTLLPRPGVFATATAVGFLMRAIALGGLHPTDLVYVGAAVAVHELALWLSGTTRGRPSPVRLALGLGSANAVNVLLGLATAAALYRLYYASWYVALLAAGPGFLYVVLGVTAAAPIAAGLRRVAP